jgi:hypothetical protein
MPKPISRNQTNVKTGARGRSGRFLAPAALIAIACLALAIVTRPASPQLDSSQTATSGTAVPVAAPQPDPPGMIDGAENPDLIPNEAAYRVVFLAFAEREDATDGERARYRAKIHPAGLGDDDETALFVILSAFKKQTDDLQAQATAILNKDPLPHPDSVDYQQLLDLDKQGRAVFGEAMSALPARLSADGVVKLDTYVKGEKRRMKYTPDMSALTN